MRFEGERLLLLEDVRRGIREMIPIVRVDRGRERGGSSRDLVNLAAKPVTLRLKAPLYLGEIEHNVAPLPGIVAIPKIVTFGIRRRKLKRGTTTIESVADASAA